MFENKALRNMFIVMASIIIVGIAMIVIEYASDKQEEVRQEDTYDSLLAAAHTLNNATPYKWVVNYNNVSTWINGVNYTVSLVYSREDGRWVYRLDTYFTREKVSIQRTTVQELVPFIATASVYYN